MGSAANVRVLTALYSLAGKAGYDRYVAELHGRFQEADLHGKIYHIVEQLIHLKEFQKNPEGEF